MYLYTPFKFSTVIANLNAFWFFKNFWDLSYKISFQPVWQKDFFEMRTAGKIIQRQPYWYTGFSGSSDSRKPFFFRFGIGYAEAPGYPNDSYHNFEIGPRYRFNDHFSLDIDVARQQDNGQYGFAYREANGQPVQAEENMWIYLQWPQESIISMPA